MAFQLLEAVMALLKKLIAKRSPCSNAQACPETIDRREMSEAHPSFIGGETELDIQS
jgi:hypothetical protein